MVYKYNIAYDDGNMLIRSSEDGHLTKFDKLAKKWIEDDEIYRVYFGDMPVREISEKEALELIK